MEQVLFLLRRSFDQLLPPLRERLGIRFNTLILPDNTRMAIQTDTIYRGNEAGEPALARNATPLPPVGRGTAPAARGSAPAARSSAFNTTAGVPALVAGTHTDAFIPGGSQLTVKLTAPLAINIGKD